MLIKAYATFVSIYKVQNHRVPISIKHGLQPDYKLGITETWTEVKNED